MNRSIAILTSILVLIAIVVSGFFIFTSLQEDTKLTIYTYDSLLADPGFAFDRAFEKFAGLENGSVKVVYFSDAGSILSRAITEKDSPIADLLIGIDNVLVGKAASNNILEEYRPNGYENLIPGLVDGLSSNYLLTPYDYGVISLWYLNDRIGGLVDNDNFMLNNLTSSEMASKTIVQDPALSSPGLGFLLHTISVFGDDQANIDGIINGDWVQFWRDLASNDVRIVPSWGAAIDLLYTEEEGRPMMVSYTSSPAYGSCLWDDDGSTSVLSHELGETWGWRQIEGIGLVKSSSNKDLAQEFIDWFISDELQSEIYQNQWIYPAIQGIDPPACYDNTISFGEINPLNDQIPLDVLAANLDSWLEQWELAVS